MRLTNLIGVILLLFQLCGCAVSQKITDGNGAYNIEWDGDTVRKIECSSEKLPGKLLTVTISREHNIKKVLINDASKKVWSKDIFDSEKVTGSSEGIVYQGASKHLGSEYYVAQEWLLESNNISLYKEIKIEDEHGKIKRQAFYGPFGISIKRP
jgi:hypothetical protein